MLLHYIGYFFITFSTLNISDIILKPNLKQPVKLLLNVLYSFLVSYILYSHIKHNLIFGIPLLYIFIFLYNLFILKSKYNKIFISTLSALGLSYVFLIISNIFISLLCLALFKNSNNIHYTYTYIPTGILQLFIILLFFRNRRITNGIRNIILSSRLYTEINISTLVILFTLFTIMNKQSLTILTKNSLNIVFITLSLLCLYYWQYRITQIYRERLSLANEKSLESEIDTLKAEIKKLEADNQHLTQIVHKDNKLVPAMETTLLKFLCSANTLSAEELTIRGNELSSALHEMALDRKGILTSLSTSSNDLPPSGLLAIDGLLSYMRNRANEYKINYRVQIENKIKDLILTTIPEDDMRHLLSDLIENAIIAVKCSKHPGHISIHFGSLQNKLLIEVSDSGIPFSPETYQNFGNEQYTCHKEDGGTGTGLMDIWSLKKKYKASLYIYEYEAEANIYTKKISFLFDGKNHFLLKTYRDKEIRNFLIRGDLHVFPHNPE